MRRSCLALLLSLALASPAFAAICDSGPRPAALLLLPYFEVDLNDSIGIKTVAYVRNTSASGALAHVTVYSDLAVPVFGFSLYLAAHGEVALDLRDLIEGGLLPQTQPPAGTFPSCNGQLPPGNLATTFITHLRASLTGQPSVVFGNRCAGRNLGDNVARGYVVIEAMNSCTLFFPNDPGYYGAGGAASDQNILSGNYVFVSLDKKQRSYGGNLVHVEASATDPETSTAGQATFGGRLTNWQATDHREPLPSTFSTPLHSLTLPPITTDLLVWRDPKVNQQAFNCPAVQGVRPTWYGLSQERFVAFDASGTPEVVASNLFPAAAQRVRAGSADLPITTLNGWMYMSLNHQTPAAGSNPPEDPLAAQGWVIAVWSEGNRFTVNFDGVAADSGCQALHSHP